MPLIQCASCQTPKLQTSTQLRSEPISGSAILPARPAWLFRMVLFYSAVFVGSVALLCAQQPTSGQDRPDAPSATRSAQTASRKPPAGFVSTIRRRSIVFPDIATSEGPLSVGEKFKLFVNDSTSPGTFAASAFGAGIGQAEDSPHGYGQGAEGFGKRFGASMARNASSEFFGTFLLASMLREDPRFFPQSDPTLVGSVKYSLTRVVVTRNDDGRNVANWSGLLGPLMAEGLANVYWPEEERTAPKTLERYGLDLATRAGSNMFRNYWPVFFKKLRRAPHSSGTHN
jgi:hypothetical protein